ncbi:unnamed protein product [Polarella glacialis]|uniref:DNA (cytosine-5-)-methyltransferase n=1 Tax=Polarella glacialis TaxID=89957 RepID=A0A813KS21_POLGL|nr:unnamed protein product [Polarella glacialis]
MGEGGGGSSSSSSRFPERCWARKMCQQLHKELLESSQGPTGLGCRPLRFGTDCAGAEAPWFALRDISRELSQQLGVAMSVDHLFACDIEWACRHFISRNSRPAALFCDLLARDRISQCVRAERPRLVPSGLDIYVAGFPCKDFSMLNRNRPCLEGPHASIFYGVVQYITRHEPAVFILENVSGLLMKRKGEEAPIHEVMATLRNIPHYQVRGWKVNSMDYYLPQNRTRVRVWAKNTCFNTRHKRWVVTRASSLIGCAYYMTTFHYDFVSFVQTTSTSYTLLLLLMLLLLFLLLFLSLLLIMLFLFLLMLLLSFLFLFLLLFMFPF